MMNPKGLFMFVDSSADSSKHRAIISTSKFTISIVGVSSIEEGASIAKQFAEEGVRIIELCGAFGYAGAKVISEAVGDQVSVGMMVHQVWNAPNLAKALEAWR